MVKSPHTMKAFTYHKYGPPIGLRLVSIPKPQPKKDQVLIKVRAVALNASDWEMLTGTPVYARIYGLFKPGYTILGSDVAGVVEAIGDDVKELKVGDLVFGDLFEVWGGLAEFTLVKEERLFKIPEGLSFEQAAAIPQSGVMALQGIRDYGTVKSGQKVLINGAGGGVGTFALQLAKHFGAEVTAVDKGEKAPLLKNLGADCVIDYQTIDFTQLPEVYDLILDVIATRSIHDYRRVLKPGGLYLLLGGHMKSLLQVLIQGPILTRRDQRQTSHPPKRTKILAHQINKGLLEIAHLVQSKQIKAAVDDPFNFEDTPAAFKKLGQGLGQGKIVIRVS